MPKHIIERIVPGAPQTGLPAEAVIELRTPIDPTAGERQPPARPASSVARSLAVFVVAGAVTLGSTACDPVQSDPVDPFGELTLESVPAELAIAETASDLATLRRLTAPFHSFDAAQKAGWTFLVPHCRDNQPTGGMGLHYANPAYIDGQVELTQPEALMYEPQKNGSMAFVGVEYAVPFSILPPGADAPELLGQAFEHNFGDELWVLHVWVGRHNPKGMFAAWNPNVSCRYYDES